VFCDGIFCLNKTERPRKKSKQTVSAMDLGFIRISFDVSVWPLDVLDKNKNKNSNNTTSKSYDEERRPIFTNSFPGTTCFEWIATLTPSDVVTKVITHLLNTSATTADEDDNSSRKMKLLKEWKRVLRLALVVDTLKGNPASAPSPPRTNHYDSITTNLSSSSSAPSSSSPSRLSIFSSQNSSSLVVLDPDVPIKNQESVLKSVRTTGRFRTLETAIVVLPFDYEAQRKEQEKKDEESTQRKREWIVKASAEDMQRKFRSIRNRDDLVRKHADRLREEFNNKIFAGAGGAYSTIEASRELEEKAKRTSDKKQKLVAKVAEMEGEWKREMVVVEQTLRRLNDRIEMYRNEKSEIEEMLRDLQP